MQETVGVHKKRLCKDIHRIGFSILINFFDNLFKFIRGLKMKFIRVFCLCHYIS